MKQVYLDVSTLPQSALDHRAAIWWGNLLLLFIESTMFAILLTSYFYIRPNFELWPPPQTNRYPIELRPLPELAPATILLVLLLLSTLPMLWASRCCLSNHIRGVKLGMAATVLAGAALAVFEYYIISRTLHVKWSDNAYASVVWALVGIHLFHTVVSTGENAVITVWLFAQGLDKKHARDIRVTAVYWYWVAGVWVVVYAVVFWCPRLL